MQTYPAIILAGGLGTRLRSKISSLPKCLAPVAGKPFLEYVIEHLRNQGVPEFIFSLGYRHNVIEQWLATRFPTLSYQCVVEEEPLGTGGAIKRACSLTDARTVLVANGDTLFRIDVNKLITAFHTHNADCALSLKPMKNTDRYGVVECHENHSIKNFKEKKHYDEGLINGGVYALNREKFLREDLGNVFSFEKAYLETYFEVRTMIGIVQDEYFIDIGVPDDYERAQRELV